MSNGHLDILRTIHKSTWIAAIDSRVRKKAEPILTLPLRINISEVLIISF